MTPFKQMIRNDVRDVFLNLDEFGEMHTLEGKEMAVLDDENEVIEREKKAKSDMDGIYKRTKLIYVRPEDFGALPAIGRTLTYDKKRYKVVDAVDEDGVYTITMEAERTGNRERSF